MHAEQSDRGEVARQKRCVTRLHEFLRRIPLRVVAIADLELFEIGLERAVDLLGALPCGGIFELVEARQQSSSGDRNPRREDYRGYGTEEPDGPGVLPQYVANWLHGGRSGVSLTSSRKGRT